MTPKYAEGQTVRTLTGEAAEIYRIEEFGTSIFYDCVVVGRGRMMVHESKLMD